MDVQLCMDTNDSMKVRDQPVHLSNAGIYRDVRSNNRYSMNNCSHAYAATTTLALCIAPISYNYSLNTDYMLINKWILPCMDQNHKICKAHLDHRHCILVHLQHNHLDRIELRFLLNHYRLAFQMIVKYHRLKIITQYI